MNNIKSKLVSANITVFDKLTNRGSSKSLSIAHLDIYTIDDAIVACAKQLPRMAYNSFVINTRDTLGKSDTRLIAIK